MELDLEERVAKIEERNKKVEGDKAWENSWTRKILIVSFTYIFAVLYIQVADTTNPWLGAVIPCAGFLLSTQSIDFIKRRWLKTSGYGNRR